MGEKYTTVPVRMSYLQIWTPKSIMGSDPKYSAVLMFDKKSKEQTADMKKIVGILENIKKAKWPDEAKRPRLPVYGKDLSFIKDADQACDRQGTPLLEKNPEYAGHWIMSLYSSEPLQFIVDRQLKPIVDKRMIYSGCYCRVRCDFYAYERDNAKGVTGTLVGLQFWEDGESFGGFQPDKLEDAFEAADDPEMDNNFFRGDEEIPF